MATVSSVINMNVEIVSTLCGSGAAVAFDGLLSSLQTNFPSSNWNSDTLLSFLNTGISQGLYLGVGTSPYGPVEGYKLNPKALLVNYPLNKVYQPFCTQFYVGFPTKNSGCGCSNSAGAGTGGNS